MFLEINLTLTQVWLSVAAFIGAVLLIGKFFKDVFGIEAFGKRIYKGEPLIWKWMMSSSIYRAETQKQLREILDEQKRIRAQVEFNGGTSIKDAVQRIEERQIIMQSEVKQMATRMDINDMCSERMRFKMDDSGACTFINDAFLKCFGYTEKDVLEFSFENLVHDADVPEMREKWTRAIEKKGRFYDEQRIIHINGEIYNCVVRAYPIIDNGILKGYEGTIDII